MSFCARINGELRLLVFLPVSFLSSSIGSLFPSGHGSLRSVSMVKEEDKRVRTFRALCLLSCTLQSILVSTAYVPVGLIRE